MGLCPAVGIRLGPGRHLRQPLQPGAVQFVKRHRKLSHSQLLRIKLLQPLQHPSRNPIPAWPLSIRPPSASCTPPSAACPHRCWRDSARPFASASRCRPRPLDRRSHLPAAAPRLDRDISGVAPIGALSGLAPVAARGSRSPRLSRSDGARQWQSL